MYGNWNKSPVQVIMIENTRSRSIEITCREPIKQQGGVSTLPQTVDEFRRIDDQPTTQSVSK